MEQKQRIAKYAFTLFQKNGIKSISMAEIAANFGISKRTLYELFENKEALLLFSIEHFMEGRYQLLDQLIAESENTIEVYLKVLHHNIAEEDWNVKFFDDIDKYFHKAAAFIKKDEIHQITMLSQFLRDGIKEGVFRADLNIDVYSFLLVELGEAYIRALKRPSLSFSVKELAYEMNLNAIRGISTSKGLKVIDSYLAKNKELSL